MHTGQVHRVWTDRWPPLQFVMPCPNTHATHGHTFYGPCIPTLPAIPVQVDSGIAGAAARASTVGTYETSTDSEARSLATGGGIASANSNGKAAGW